MLLMLAYALVIASHNTLKTVSNSAMIATFGASKLPWAGLAGTGLMFAFCTIVILCKTLHTKLSRIVGLGAALALCIVVTFPALHAVPGLGSLLTVLFYLSGDVLVYLGLYCVWMLLTSAAGDNPFRNMTIFGMGPQLSALAAMLAIRSALPQINVYSLSYVIAAGYLIAFFVIVMGICKFRCYGLAESDFMPEGQNGRSLSFRSLWLVARIPYLRLLAIVIITDTAFAAALRWQVYRAAEYAGATNGVAMFVSTFYLYIGYAALAAQLVLVPLAFRFLTPRYGLLLLPMLGLVAVLTRSYSASTTSLLVSVALFSSIDYTVNNCMRETLYIPLPLHVKVHLKAALALLIPKIGDVIGSGLILLLGNTGIRTWTVSMAAVLGVWIAAAWLTLKVYRGLSTRVMAETAEAVDKIE